MPSSTILLVEDNADDEELTVRALKMSNIANRLDVVRDGAEALEYLHGNGNGNGEGLMPSLVLLDLKLPKVDGLDVLRRIRAEGATRLLPVVILTSSKLESDIAASYNDGANSYVRKPVDFERFAEAVRQLGLYWLVLNEPPPGPGD
jgi:two-component system response regulator